MRKIDLQGKVAVIAGGAGDIGLELAKGLAQAGSLVVIIDRNLEPIKGKLNSRIKGFTADLTEVKDIQRAIVGIAEKFKRIDILVHAAGVNFHKTFFDMNEPSWDTTLAVNLKSAFFLSQAVVPHMIKKGGGKLVFLSSCSAKVGARSGMSDYTASKGGMEALVRNLACELAPYHICVNAIAPGTTRTRMTTGLWKDPKKCRAHEATIPLGRMATPADHVGPVLFFASELSDYVTGTVLPSDGGLTIMQADFIDLKLRNVK